VSANDFESLGESVMDAIARSLSTLVDLAIRDNLDRGQVITVVSKAELESNNESYREALRGMRYFVRHGAPPQNFMPSDFDAIKPLIVALVERGLI
jgi:hypothetical protein